MTLKELKTRCIEQGFPFAYGLFKQPQEPPHIVVLEQESDNFGADNKVYKKKTGCELFYTYLEKDTEEQNKIEDIILSDIYWEKSEEVYNSSDDYWQVSYFFELEE